MVAVTVYPSVVVNDSNTVSTNFIVLLSIFGLKETPCSD